MVRLDQLIWFDEPVLCGENQPLPCLPLHEGASFFEPRGRVAFARRHWLSEFFGNARDEAHRLPSRNDIQLLRSLNGRFPKFLNPHAEGMLCVPLDVERQTQRFEKMVFEYPGFRRFDPCDTRIVSHPSAQSAFLLDECLSLAGIDAPQDCS